MGRVGRLGRELNEKVFRTRWPNTPMKWKVAKGTEEDVEKLAAEATTLNEVVALAA